MDPGIQPAIRGIILAQSRLLRSLRVMLILMNRPQRVQMGTASLMSMMKAIKGMATSAAPKPVNPCTNPAVKKIAGINRRGDINYFLRRVSRMRRSEQFSSAVTSAFLTRQMMSMFDRWSGRTSAWTVAPDLRT